MIVHMVQRIRTNPSGKILAVQWQKVDPSVPRYLGSPEVVDVDRVVEALDHGDVVHLEWWVDEHTVMGPRVERDVLPNGTESIRSDDPNRPITQLPKI
ncbi:hypothetical protein [Microcystis phage Mae-JY22]